MFPSMNTILSMMMIMTAPIMMMSMESWVAIWVMMEMSSISFITMMKNNPTNEGAILYFMAQSFGSFMILYSVMSSKMSSSSSTMTENMMMVMGMMIKIGVIPFHQWFIMLSKSIKMKEMFILFTIQKIPPFLFTSWVSNKTMLTTILMTSTIMSLFMQMSQTSMKMLLTYSSIFQTSWVMLLSMINIPISMMYFTIYSMTLMMVMMEMNTKSIMNMVDQETKSTLPLMINMTSMSGIPPMLGFIPKWMMFKTMTQEQMSIMAMSMLVMSVISFFIYFRLLFSTWMKTKMTMKKPKPMKNLMMIQILTPILMLMSW